MDEILGVTDSLILLFTEENDTVDVEGIDMTACGNIGGTICGGIIDVCC